MTAGNAFMVLVYASLAFFWFGVSAVVLWILIHGRRPMVSSQYLGFLSASLFVAIVLFIDSSYWAVANLSGVGFLDRSIEPLLRNPWLVAVVKLLVLVSAIAFLLVASRSAGLFGRGFEDRVCADFIDRTWDAIGILDRDGRVTLWNRGAETLFGFPRDFAVGKHIKEFLVPQDLHQDLDARLTEIKATKQAAQNYNTQRLTRDGRRLDVEISISPILGSHFDGFFGIMRKSAPHVLSIYFENREGSSRDRPYLFAAIPFDLSVVPKDVWTVAIQEAARLVGLDAIRVDHEAFTGPIINKIYDGIRHSEVVVADLSGSNPNVFYEVGLAHVLGKPVIQPIQEGETIPFDVAGMKSIKYSRDQASKLRDELERQIIACVRAGARA
jgi:PAS domain S-box-containing protein